MSEQTPAHHTAEHWAQMSRHLEWFTVKSIQDQGDSVQINQSNGWSFSRSKASLGREIRVGERLALETVKLTQITGLRDASGWLFRLTDQDLADEARKFSEDLHRKDVERLERNRKLYAEHETNLPDWLKVLEGWGYELMICRLADLLDRGLEDEADKLARDEGASGNQWDCAKALAAGRKRHGDEFGSALPAGLAPITGSADYS
ncbi:hypothetical protein [Mycobacterium marinum]|uniref:hypothetical protein n=1 Tax=Mycobacterium marinum TaxID=1781 RepID=UPI00356628A2